MKVIVCFGETRVLVPCEPGEDMTVKDLTERAVARYKKVTNKVCTFLYILSLSTLVTWEKQVNRKDKSELNSQHPNYHLFTFNSLTVVLQEKKMFEYCVELLLDQVEQLDPPVNSGF